MGWRFDVELSNYCSELIRVEREGFFRTEYRLLGHQPLTAKRHWYTMCKVYFELLVGFFVMVSLAERSRGDDIQLLLRATANITPGLKNSCQPPIFWGSVLVRADDHVVLVNTFSSCLGRIVGVLELPFVDHNLELSKSVEKLVQASLRLGIGSEGLLRAYRSFLLEHANAPRCRDLVLPAVGRHCNVVS